ncbi:LOW QUALITY PROTEIN: hypothetical protein TorRG33x02_291660 [Trema orientale]|uniref:Uncharacterized protein n=1 Tax=Trema orientale TaxID=63057 RepID=A0A2P5CBC7_TREOI|nr:LOW QUALITY PROTEIN: hypothetical protein TorRG33x02_291660 [Trema orientale]
MKAFIREFVGEGRKEMKCQWPTLDALPQKSQETDLLGFLPSLLYTIPVSPTNYHDDQLAHWAHLLTGLYTSRPGIVTRFYNNLGEFRGAWQEKNFKNLKVLNFSKFSMN